MPLWGLWWGPGSAVVTGGFVVFQTATWQEGVRGKYKIISELSTRLGMRSSIMGRASYQRNIICKYLLPPLQQPGCFWLGMLNSMIDHFGSLEDKTFILLSKLLKLLPHLDFDLSYIDKFFFQKKFHKWFKNVSGPWSKVDYWCFSPICDS